MQVRLESGYEKSMRKFLVIWAGQFLSILGSGISAFGLSIWILTTTSSDTGFAMSFLVQILPGILFVSSTLGTFQGPAFDASVP